MRASARLAALAVALGLAARAASGVPRPVLNLDRSVRELAAAGATRVLVPNLPDLRPPAVDARGRRGGGADRGRR